MCAVANRGMVVTVIMMVVAMMMVMIMTVCVTVVVAVPVRMRVMMVVRVVVVHSCSLRLVKTELGTILTFLGAACVPEGCVRGSSRLGRAELEVIPFRDSYELRWNRLTLRVSPNSR